MYLIYLCVSIQLPANHQLVAWMHSNKSITTDRTTSHQYQKLKNIVNGAQLIELSTCSVQEKKRLFPFYPKGK